MDDQMKPEGQQQTFSDYLLEKYAADFKKATNHPFLAQAGAGTIDPSKLKEWLKQDYLYAFIGYIKFASSLLSKLHLTYNPNQATNTQRAVEVITFSLSNVKRETDFFLSTAQEHGLGVFDPTQTEAAGADGKGAGDALLGEYNEITRAYVDFLHAIGGLASIEEGFTLLWAMEKAYFESWKYARSKLPTGGSFENPNETQKALEKFIDNWTNEEFEGFVEGCREIMDRAEIIPGSELGQRCEEVFKRTIWLEQRFWPDVGV